MQERAASALTSVLGRQSRFSCWFWFWRKHRSSPCLGRPRGDHRGRVLRGRGPGNRDWGLGFYTGSDGMRELGGLEWFQPVTVRGLGVGLSGGVVSSEVDVCL